MQYIPRKKWQISVNVQRLLQNIELHSLLSYSHVSVVSGRDDRLNFNRLRVSLKTFAILVGPPPSPGLLPPCPVNHPRSKFSHRDPYFVFRQRIPERRGIIIVCSQKEHSRGHVLRLVCRRLNYNIISRAHEISCILLHVVIRYEPLIKQRYNYYRMNVYLYIRNKFT